MHMWRKLRNQLHAEAQLIAFAKEENDDQLHAETQLHAYREVKHDHSCSATWSGKTRLGQKLSPRGKKYARHGPRGTNGEARFGILQRLKPAGSS